MGGGSSQPKNTTTTTKTELPAWLTNDYQQFIGQTNQINDKPYQSYGGQLNANLSAGQTQALQNAAYMGQGNSNQQGALGGILNGAYNVYAQQNPYAGSGNLDQVVNQSNSDIISAYNKSQAPQLAAQFSQGGAFGGSAMDQALQTSQQTLADRLAANTTGLRYQDLQNQQQLWQQGYQNQLSSAQNNVSNILGASSQLNGTSALQAQWNSQLAGLGQAQQDYNQGNLDQAYNDWYQQNYGYDQQRLANYGNALNAISGNFQSSATTGANPAYRPKTVGGGIATIGGGALAGAAAGSVIPGLGTVAGGLIGGIGSGLGYYL